VGDGVSVFIKSIRPERMKIKLQVIETLPPPAGPEPNALPDPRRGAGAVVYSPPGYEKEPVETVFTPPDLDLLPVNLGGLLGLLSP
jgi:small subunit ribosomal protein S1